MTMPASTPVSVRSGAGPRGSSGPLGAFEQGLRVNGAIVPSPLVATSIAIAARGHLATVTTRRRFRNAEPVSIEATLTYPVPIEAAAHGLVVRIGDRRLVGQAHAKAAAREAYEQAIDDGRTAVLHEEPLKGIHVLSVGQVPPGVEVEVESVWTKALALVDGRAVLSVPTTVGEIYGRLALDVGDELAVDGPPADAEVKVEAGDAAIRLCGEPLASGASMVVPLDRHIVVSFDAMPEATLTGTAADGRAVALSVRPAGAGEGALDLVVLFDRSGSMSETFRPHGGRAGPSVHAAACEALRAVVADRFRREDRLELWQFDDEAERIGNARGQAALALLRRLGPPRGGTEIGRAIATVFARDGRPRDLLLVTDGRSGALDVHALASQGWRVSVLLCGSASLDALPGHLAALTDGELVAVGGGGDGPAEVVAALAAMVGRLRDRRSEVGPSDLSDLPDRLRLRRGGAEVSASWSGDSRPGVAVDAVGAYAASLALPMLTNGAATRVAVAHGLVTHLSSLLVVDAEGPQQSTIPSHRKVPLPQAAAAMPMPAPPPCASAPFAPPPPVVQQPCVAEPPQAAAPLAAYRAPRARGTPAPAASAPPSFASASAPPIPALRRAASAIDWTAQGPALAAGDLSTVEGWILAAIEAAAADPEVLAAARAARLTPVGLVVALMAAADPSDRTRARIARRVAGLPVARRIARLIGL